MRIFVINLKRSADRKVHIIKQLDNLNIAYEFIDAIDGQGLSDDEIKMHGVDTFPPWFSFNQRHLVKGEIGCILSHLGIYRKMIDEDIECACIFEDDCVFEKDLGIILKNEQLRRSDYELLLLGHSGQYQDTSRGAECSSKKEPVLSRYHIAKPVERPFGTYAYIIKQCAALKLLQYAYPLRLPMDCLTGHAQAIGVKLRILTPPIVTHNVTLGPSTINDRDSNSRLYVCKARRIKCMVGRKYPILRMIKKICLFPYVTLLLKLRKAGILDGDSYAEKRYFRQNSLAKYPQPPVPRNEK
ncbi:MAG: glycosyltransferase family 25 protein [Verrucomicrobia bacterium]|nr:glycosyltransferase family 25 protein [Verrucomicrobiota bacterium]MBU1734224.1 glycosyltransferase family 25 protein [Verrucomicrobiota bacterium]MBU1855762.1 glycosyltransferase family 25 protein [Verrucomicrobiota bacterium]